MGRLVLPFDKIFCLNLCERSDRRDYMERQFQQLGISDQITWFEVVKHPHTDFIAKKLREEKIGGVNNGGAFNCTREHYTMIKSSYLKGYNSILILEDDISLLNDPDQFSSILSEIPCDWDILRFAALWNIAGLKEISSYSEMWNVIKSRFWGTSGYALNREGMRFLIDKFDNHYYSADVPLFYYPDSLRMYTPLIPLGIIKRSEYSKSDIQMQGSDTDILRDPNYSQLPLDYSKYGPL